MKKLLVGIVLLLVIVGGVIYTQLNSIVKTGVETGGPGALHVGVTLDSVALSPFSGHATLKGLAIGQPSGFGDGAIASVGMLDVKLVPKSLLGNHIFIDEITIDQPFFDVRMIDGKTNFKALQDGLGPVEESEPSPITLTIRKLSVTAPKLSLQSQGAVKIDKDVNLAGFTLTNLGTDEKGLAPREIARHVMDTLQPQIAKALVAAGAGEKLQSIVKDAKGTLEDQLGGVLGSLKKKKDADPNN